MCGVVECQYSMVLFPFVMIYSTLYLNYSRSSEPSSLPDSMLQPSIPLTGDSRADADIIAFYKARQKLIQKGGYVVYVMGKFWVWQFD